VTIEPRHVRFHEIAKRAPPPPLLLPPPPLPPLLLLLPLLPLAAYYLLTTTVVLVLWRKSERKGRRRFTLCFPVYRARCFLHDGDPQENHPSWIGYPSISAIPWTGLWGKSSFSFFLSPLSFSLAFTIDANKIEGSVALLFRSLRPHAAHCPTCSRVPAPLLRREVNLQPELTRVRERGSERSSDRTVSLARLSARRARLFPTRRK